MIRRVAIVGAGTMGTGIAITCLAAGLPTTLIDTANTALGRAKDRIYGYFVREVDKGRMTPGQKERAVQFLTLSTGLEAPTGADLTIDAVLENIDVKQKSMKRLEPFLPADSIVATNTSCLQVGVIAKGLADPGRLIGLHYFSPAERSPVVEVVSSNFTREAVRTRALGFLAATQKTPLPCKDRPGFALNRFFCPYCNEAARLQETGIATPAQIDAIAREAFGVPAGPFRVMNLTKPVIMLRAMQGLASLGDGYVVARSLQEQGDAGRSWNIDDTETAVTNDVRKKVVERLQSTLHRTAMEAIDEGIASPSDMETGARLALGFEETSFLTLRA